MLRSILVSGLVVIGMAAAADESDARWQIQSVEMNQVEEEIAAPLAFAEGDCSALQEQHDLELNDLPLADIINMGAKMWDFIVANKPVVNMSAPPMANALPSGSNCWANLENWSAPKSESYQIVYKNGFGMEAVKLRVRLQYTYGGSRAGLGRYLANVTVVPGELNVLWGYTFNASVNVGRPVNLGSTMSPLAGIELTVNWDTKTVMQVNQGSMSFFVQGNGLVSKAE